MRNQVGRAGPMNGRSIATRYSVAAVVAAPPPPTAGAAGAAGGSGGGGGGGCAAAAAAAAIPPGAPGKRRTLSSPSSSSPTSGLSSPSLWLADKTSYACLPCPPLLLAPPSSHPALIPPPFPPPPPPPAFTSLSSTNAQNTLINTKSCTKPKTAKHCSTKKRLPPLLPPRMPAMLRCTALGRPRSPSLFLALAPLIKCACERRKGRREGVVGGVYTHKQEHCGRGHARSCECLKRTRTRTRNFDAALLSLGLRGGGLDQKNGMRLRQCRVHVCGLGGWCCEAGGATTTSWRRGVGRAGRHLRSKQWCVRKQGEEVPDMGRALLCVFLQTTQAHTHGPTHRQRRALSSHVLIVPELFPSIRLLLHSSTSKYPTDC